MSSSAPDAHGLLAGRRILVTGGSGGIGQGICSVAAREGAKVLFTWNRNDDGAQRTVELIERAGASCLAVQVDLVDPNAATTVMTAAEKEWGGIDGLVNNAAFSESVPFVFIEDEELHDILELNLVAPFRMCRAVARGMIREKYGRIVNISSIAGSRAIPGPVHYATTKGALEGMTRSLAQELGPYGVLVNAVAAGIFEGGLKSTIPEHHQKRYLDACALSRTGRPEECGEIVTWLLSERNTYTNGTVVFVDGGTLG